MAKRCHPLAFTISHCSLSLLLFVDFYFYNCSSEVLVLHLKFLLLHNATALLYILEGNAFFKNAKFLRNTELLH